jgi:hypothetical protein
VPVVTADANMNARRVEVEALRLDRDGRSNCRRADEAQRNGCDYQGPQDAFLLC